MTDLTMFQQMGEALGVQPWVLQILAIRADIYRRQVAYDFDAARFYGEHVGLTFGEKVPEGDAAIGAVVRSAIAATNAVAGGGAAGYLAVIEMMMVSFRADYHHADELVRHYVLHQPELPESGSTRA